MTMLLAMIAAPLIDTAVYGRAPSPNDRYNPNSRLDNIEQEGWSIKGPQSYIESPEVAGNSGGPAAEMEINKFPTNDAQLKHIFREAEGHLLDTPANRGLVENTANNSQNLIGKDMYGTQWYTQLQSDGSQVWVRTYNGTIINAGINSIARTFDPQTGLNNNPLK